ncbi:hypothetical protein BYT27DRAFT_7201466, partial [Phlegmacium glaucopus]
SASPVYSQCQGNKDQCGHSLQLKLDGDYVFSANETCSEFTQHSPTSAPTSASASKHSPTSDTSSTFPNPSNHLEKRQILICSRIPQRNHIRNASVSVLYRGSWQKLDHASTEKEDKSKVFFLFLSYSC